MPNRAGNLLRPRDAPPLQRVHDCRPVAFAKTGQQHVLLGRQPDGGLQRHNELAQRTAKVLTTGVLDAAVFNEESVEESTVALRVPSQVVVSGLPAHLS